MVLAIVGIRIYWWVCIGCGGMGKDPEELVRKSWTDCEYPAEKDLTCSNEDLLVVFSDE